MAPRYPEVRLGSRPPPSLQSHDAHDKNSKQHRGRLLKARVYRTKYSSLFVPVPADFLLPLSPQSVKRLHVEQIDFTNTALPEYSEHYAVIIDGLLTNEECQQLLRYAEMSAGGHGHVSNNASAGKGHEGASFQELNSGRHQEGAGKAKTEDEGAETEPSAGKKPDGWHRALVRTGANREMLSLRHLNSDRVIWHAQDVATRLWRRVQQVESVRKQLEVLEGEKYGAVMGKEAVRRREKWRVSGRGLMKA